MALLDLLGLAALSVVKQATDAISKHKKEKREYEHLLNGDSNAVRIKMKKNDLYYKNKDVDTVKQMFKSYGFTNIVTKVIKSYSLKQQIKNFLKSGKVSSVKIGKRFFEAKDTFFSDEIVVIRYYE